MRLGPLLLKLSLYSSVGFKWHELVEYFTLFIQTVLPKCIISTSDGS